MDLNQPLPRLMRLRGMVARTVPPDDATITGADQGLIETYNRLRGAVRELAVSLSIDGQEFDRELPVLPPVSVAFGPMNVIESAKDPKTAAATLRSLAGYVEGLIEAVVLEEQITMEQIEAAREAARQPPGFR